MIRVQLHVDQALRLKARVRPGRARGWIVDPGAVRIVGDASEHRTEHLYPRNQRFAGLLGSILDRQVDDVPRALRQDGQASVGFRPASASVAPDCPSKRCVAAQPSEHGKELARRFPVDLHAQASVATRRLSSFHPSDTRGASERPPSLDLREWAGGAPCSVRFSIIRRADVDPPQVDARGWAGQEVPILAGRSFSRRADRALSPCVPRRPPADRRRGGRSHAALPANLARKDCNPCAVLGGHPQPARPALRHVLRRVPVGPRHREGRSHLVNPSVDPVGALHVQPGSRPASNRRWHSCN